MSKTLRVLHLVSHLSGGGAERQLSYLAPELTRLGCDVHIAFLEEGPVASPFLGKGIYLHKLNHRGNYDPRILIQIVRLIKRIKPDIIHTWMLQMDIVGGIGSYLKKTPQVLREPFVGRFPSANWKNIVRERLARMNEAVIVSNSEGGNRYWAARCPRLDRYIISNALNLSGIEQSDLILRKEIGLPPEARFILYAGRLDTYQKNLENLFKAFIMVCSKHDIYAVICGKGSYRNHLNLAISNNGLTKHILLKGFVENIWSYMKAADMLVCVSYFEGRPNTVLEAMACGCPLVVSNIQAHREFLDEDTAIFVNPQDPADIAEGINTILMSPLEAKMRAMRAKEMTSQWSILRMTQAYMHVYTNIIGAPNLTGHYQA